MHAGRPASRWGTRLRSRLRGTRGRLDCPADRPFTSGPHTTVRLWWACPGRQPVFPRRPVFPVGARRCVPAWWGKHLWLGEIRGHQSPTSCYPTASWCPRISRGAGGCCIAVGSHAHLPHPVAGYAPLAVGWSPAPACAQSPAGAGLRPARSELSAGSVLLQRRAPMPACNRR